MKCMRLLAGVVILGGAGTALADDAFLRLRCEGEAAGGEVRINGVKKGECPIDLVVPEGEVKISVRKTLDQYRFKSFEKEVFLSAGAMKREAVVLGPLQFTPEGQRLENERLARERAEAERIAAEQAVVAEKHRLELEETLKYGITNMVLQGMSSRDPDPSSASVAWTYGLPSLPFSVLSDVSEGKRLYRSAGDPAVFANPDAKVSQAARAGTAVPPSGQP